MIQIVDHCISFRRFLLAIAFIVIETFFEDTKGAKHICESKEDILKWVGKLDIFTLKAIDFEKKITYWALIYLSVATW
jgi:hypothetical protein